LINDLPSFGLLKSVAVLGVGVALREAYSTDVLQFEYPSIDIHFVLFHLKFEDMLYISVLKNRATCHKNLQLQIVKFLKRSYEFKPRPPNLFHT
jgi:hypothetical protein